MVRVGFNEHSRALYRVQQLERTRNVVALIRELYNSAERGGLSVRGDAALALGRIGDPHATPYLLALIDDPSEHVRWNVVRALGDLGDAAAIPTLIASLSDSAALVRMSSARVLGTFRTDEALQPLRIAANDADPWVRLYATEALAAMGDTDAHALAAASLAHERWWRRGDRHRRKRWRAVMDAVGGHS